MLRAIRRQATKPFPLPAGEGEGEGNAWSIVLLLYTGITGKITLDGYRLECSTV